jgi:hypothetical protein
MVPFVTCIAQDNVTTQIAGIDNSKMGAYRGLAQLSFQAFQKGDLATSAKLARILERTWDAGEGDLAKNNPSVFEDVDHAMDVLIKPLMAYDKTVPNPTEIQSAYSNYLAKLNEAEK